MIKKSIASILIILISINSIGCMSYHKIRIDDQNKIEEADEVRLTTVNNKKYQLRNVKIEGSKIFGDQWVNNEKIMREFSAKQILYIEVEKVDIIWLVLGAAGLVFIFGFNDTLLAGDWHSD